MDAFLQPFQHLKIPLEDIKKATNNFDNKNHCIGGGGFGKVYKGEVYHSMGRSMVAIKRLDPRHGQGIPEFLKEITTLSRYNHENLISLLGFCYQGDEMILVYEYASRGSLDRHLNSPRLMWSQRLKICLDAAKGISYLHDPRETHQRLIHCDVKSANILLDDQWNGLVSDFGLSIMGPANELQSIIITLAAGTPGYIDPQYRMTHTLTKESDVYSFGVVLFEVLCGRLCCIYSNGRVHQNFLPMWIEGYKQKKLNGIIFKSPNIQPLHQRALETISDIAYRCLKDSREDRPKMAEVVTKLENALAIQQLSEGKLRHFINELETPPPWNFSYKEELCELLCEGVLLNDGKTWFASNKKGEHCEMISIAECLDSDVKRNNFSTEYNSRFAMGTYYYYYGDEILKTHVKTQFLSLGITYTVNLVFKCPELKKISFVHIGLNYKLRGDTKNSISHMAYEREDRWWRCELYQFTSDHRTIDLQILFEGFGGPCSSIEVEGIEFWPTEKVEHKDENQPIIDSDSDTNWEEKMPTDYEDIMKLSENYQQWTTKEEAYQVIRKGFFINVDKKRGIWFYLDENGKKCYMLSCGFILAKVSLMCFPLTYAKIFLPESRFEEAVHWDSNFITIEIKVLPLLVSSETAYAIYLVYKLPKDQSEFEAPVLVTDTRPGLEEWYICLSSPQTPFIRPQANQNTHNPLNNPKIKGFPQQRNDGWMEVQIWEWQAPITTYKRLVLTHLNKKFGKLIIEGFEFRPI